MLAVIVGLAGTAVPPIGGEDKNDALIRATRSGHKPAVELLRDKGAEVNAKDNVGHTALSADCYTGWPVTLQLADGSLITSYAVTIYVMEKDKPKTACEVVRWRLP